MPSANWTVPDSSPWVTYTGIWYDSDALTQYYNNGTFHFANSSSASASVQFNGTGVTLYGAKRSNHGLFTVTLDGQPTTINGTGADVLSDFNLSLFHQNGLDPSKQHMFTVSDGDRYVDIDWLEIEVGDGKIDTPSHDVWLDDTSANVTYDENWQIGAKGLTSEYYQETFHATNVLGAKATISFYGNAIALYGAVSTNHGNFTVSLDGANPTTYSGSEIAFRPQMLLWMANNLANGSHQVVLSNMGSGPNGYTDLDYAIVTVWPTSGLSSNPNGPGSGSHPTSSNSDTGAIAGGIIGSIGGLLLILGLSFWLWHLRRHRHGHGCQGEYMIDIDGDGLDTGTLQTGATITPFVVPLAPPSSSPPPSAHPTPPHPTWAHPQDMQEGPAQDMPPPDYDRVFKAGAPTSSASKGSLSTSAFRPRAPLPVREKRNPPSPNEAAYVVGP